MKRVKNYIETELAKKKIARYKYWSIKDENGITICSSEDNNPDNKTFADVLDKIIGDNVDAEVQIKYGTNEQSSRQNPPFFIRVNEEIEWIEPEEDETVSINGVPHRVDKNGNVNINLTTPTNEPPRNQPKIENGNIDVFRQEMEFQLQGLRREYELKEEKNQAEMQNRLLEQTLKFKEMMLAERESRVIAREQAITNQENTLDEKQREIQEDVKGYLKQIPNALGGLIKDWVKDGASKDEKSLGKAEKKKAPKRRKVNFSVQPESSEPNIEEDISDEDLEAEIAQYEAEEQQESQQEAELPLPPLPILPIDETQVEPLKEQENENI